jgi:TRAP-type C4-dicarboxylate transport system permease small subunit
MEKLLKGIDQINTWLMYLAALILGGIVLLILFEILLWNLTEVSTLITDEYSAYGLAAIVFFGAGYTLKEEGHIRITLLVNMFPSKISRWITISATLLSTLLMGYMLFFLYKMIFATYRYQTTSGTLTNTLLWIPQAIMYLGAVGFFLQLIASSIRVITDRKGADQIME